MSQRARGGSRRSVITAVVVTAVVLVGAATAATAIAMAGGLPVQAAGPTASASTPPLPAPTATPHTLEQELLQQAEDRNACVVTYAGDGISNVPALQLQGVLYAGLPIPARDGLVFAGWYASPEAAAALAIPSRVNGSKVVACENHQVTLYGAWTTPEANAAEKARIPILMYHQFTAKPEGEEGWLRGNYAYIGDFDAHMNHIATTGFYLPTWDELSAFIDGRLFLPNHSVIVTDDDADQSWFDLAVPVVDTYKVLATSFMITAYRQDPAPSPYVLRRSHTHDMHQAGANGKGRIVNWSAAEIAADMQSSGGVLGVKEVMAYPYGHYNETSKEGLRQAGWDLARTIEPGYVSIGTDKLALPTVRINYGMGLAALINLIG